MQLKILARGHVRYAVGIFLGQLRHGLKLRGIQATRRNLDALHPGRVPERVGTLGQIGRGKVQALDFLAVAALAIVIALSVVCPASFSFQRVFEAFTIRSLLANPWLPSPWKSGPLGPAELKLAPSKSPVLRGHEWPLFHDKSSPKTKTHLPVLLAVGVSFRNFA